MQRHLITLFKTQTSTSSTYVEANCISSLFYCSHTLQCGYTEGVQDPVVGSVPCGFGCPPQNICLKPDRAEAFIGLSSNGEDPLIHICWNVRPPNLRCVYDVDKINTASQINTLMRLYSEIQITHLMRAFCTQPISTCPNGMNKCSRLLSTDESGEMCREWMERLPSDSYRDSVMREYCLFNNTDDCRCINRTKHDEFNNVQGEMNAITLASTRCWYKPCQDNNNLLLNVEQKQECNANICQSIIDAHAQGNVNIEGNKSSINCNFDKASTTPTTTTDSNSAESKLVKRITIGVAVLLLIVLLVRVIKLK